jgi:hypothetical protein
MRIEVSVPGIKKERGKLPAPITRGPPRLVLPLAARPPICGELVEPASSGAVTGVEVCEPVAIPHPVNAETTTSPTNRLRQRISFLRSVVPTTAMRWSFQSACQVLRS